MTAHSLIPVHPARLNEWAELRSQADAEDDRLWDSLVSGHRDAERLRRSQAGVVLIASLPPLERPDPAEARRRAEAAVVQLIGDLLAS